MRDSELVVGMVLAAHLGDWNERIQPTRVSRKPSQQDGRAIRRWAQ